MAKKILIIVIAIVYFTIIPNVKAENFSKEMPNSSYIIGENLYTRAALEEYKGVLTTEYIMKAAQTINEDDLSAMIIYYKNPRGVLTNALTGQNVSESEETLMDNVKYYNGKKIPTLSLNYSETEGSSGDNCEYLLSLKTLADEELLWNIIDWDIYGAKEWNSDIYSFTDGVSDNTKLKLIQKDVGKNSNSGYSYKVTQKKGQYYSYVAFPYIYNGDDKIYISPLDGVTIYAGAKVVPTITGNKIKLNVTGLENYKIVEADLYASRNTKLPGVHVEANDIVTFLKNSDTHVNKLNNNFFAFLNIIENMKESIWGDTSNSYYWYLAESYLNDGEGSALKEITLGDVGNSEKEKNWYKADLTISSPDVLNGREFTIYGDTKVEGTVYQPDSLTTSEHEAHLVDLLLALTSLDLEEVNLTKFYPIEFNK